MVAKAGEKAGKGSAEPLADDLVLLQSSSMALCVEGKQLVRVLLVCVVLPCITFHFSRGAIRTQRKR